jgi:hypothetical protein
MPSPTNKVSIRLPNSTMEILKKKADEKDLPISSLMVKILNENVLFDVHLKPLPYVILSQVLFEEIIKTMTDSQIDKVASMGPSIVTRLCQISRWDYDVDSVIENYFVMISKYCGLFQLKKQVQHNHYHLVFETKLGTKWEKFLSIFVRSILESIGIHIDRESVNDGIIIFEFEKRNLT